MSKRKTLSKILLSNMLLVTTLACVSTGGLWIGQEILSFNHRVTEERERLIQERKERMQNEVDSAVSYLDFMRSQVEERTRRAIRDRTLEAHQTATHLYETWKNKKSRAALENLVREALRPARFLNGRGYYFATRLDGVEMLCAACAHLEGKNLLGLRDMYGAYVIRDMTALVRKQNEGFYRYTWSKPDTPGREHLKLAYVKHFAPFNWFIGTGEYVEDTEHDLQQEALDWIRHIRYDDDAYLFAGRWDGITLSGPATGQNMLDVTDSNGVRIVQKMIDLARENGGFFEYVMPKIEGQRPELKISYVRGLPAWEWYIGTGLYIDDIEKKVAESRQHARSDLFWNIGKICTILALLWLGAFALAARLNVRTRAMLKEFSEFFNRSAKDQTEMPVDMLAIDEFRELAEGANRMIARRRMIEDALRESEQSLLEAQRIAHLGGWQIDLGSGRLFWTNETFRIYDLPNTEQPTLEQANSYLLPESRKLFEQAIHAAVEEGRPFNLELQSRTAEGHHRWVCARGETKYLTDGRHILSGSFQDITAIKAYQSKLEHIAHFDVLTNLPNRALLADRLHQAMAQAQRRRKQVVVAYLDLDGFKQINDRHGHETGDQMLVCLAHRMSEALRESDSMARIGGDEFVAVLSDLDDISFSPPLLNRLLEAAALPVQVGDLNLQVSASLGATFFPQAQEIDAEQLLRQADQAMYQAKLSGKNRYHIFDAAQDNSIRDYHESLERLRLALAHNEFVLHYQPKVNMRNGKITGAEALIRWQHPEKGLLGPAAFLPLIEDHALAVDVGEWVIESVLHQMARWRAVGLDLPVSVNIGARQLQQSNFFERLQVLLERHKQVPPDRLELEILETSALLDMDQVSQVIENCARMGVQCALDDFGTGYSSLTYIKRLGVTTLKIDQSFVRDMLDDPDDLAILKGIIGLAAAFKREVIAEGVETVAHGTALLELGCELAQGYGIARPMPPDHLPDWVATWQPDAAWRSPGHVNPEPKHP